MKDKKLMNKENNNEAPGTPEEAVKNQIDAALANIDFDKVTESDIFQNIMHNSQMFAFHLAASAAALEQLHIRKTIGKQEPDNVVKFNDDEPKS